MRILANHLAWLGPAVDTLAERHELITLADEAVRETWASPDADWWRRAVPDGWVPDVAVFSTPEYLPVPPLLSALPCPVALWVGDWYANWQGVAWIADQVELVLADATGVASLRRAGVRELGECCPWTYDPRRHRPDWDAEPERDVGFLGNLNEALQQPRNRWLGRLARLPADVDVQLSTGRFGDDYVRFVQRSRITFNYSLTGDVNMRCFEATACGSMTILNAQAAAQASRWFELGRELVIYDEDTLEDVIAHYLRHDDERRAVARAGYERVQQHGPHHRLGQLLGHLEGLAGQARRADLPSPARAAGRSALLSLSVADPEALAGYEQALDAAEREAPDDPVLQVGYAVLYATLAGAGHPQGPDALVWAGEHLERAARLGPADAIAALGRAQLMYALGDHDIAHALAEALVVELLARRAVARADRLPLVDSVAWRAQRQTALLSDDPQGELTRLALVETLKLAADAAPTPAQRADHLAAALAASGGEPAVRLRLAIALLACDPVTALGHTELILDELPINGVGWAVHARALLAGGRSDETAAFVADALALAERVHVDPALLEQLRASTAAVAVGH